MPDQVRFTMLQILDEEQQAGDATIRLRVYVPDMLDEDDNDLPCLFSIEAGGAPPRWTLAYWAHQERWVDRARLAFDEAIQQALADYHRSGRARDDVRLRDASRG
jgi:hypothetical protein